MEHTTLSDTYHPSKGIRVAPYQRRGMRIKRTIQTTMNDKYTSRLLSRYDRINNMGTPMVGKEADIQSSLYTNDINDVISNTPIYKKE